MGLLRLRFRAVLQTTSFIKSVNRRYTHGPLPNHAIYVSNSRNPYFNLSLEDWLFRHKNHAEPLLLLYRNDPCVVIGRNQNPWTEVNFRALREAGIPFIRRRSGGGTVYHDLGNTNYSIHLSRLAFDRHATAQVVVRAVRALGIDAEVNDRNDITVSGSAYKIANKRAYHHGTMLLRTDLDNLGEILHAYKESLKSKGVTSVRSAVRNLSSYQPAVQHDKFVEAMITSFTTEYGIPREVQYVNEEDFSGIQEIHDGMLELPSWDWAYGQTPEFEYNISKIFSWSTVEATIRSKHGIVLSCEIGDSRGARHAPVYEWIRKALKDQRYGFLPPLNIRLVSEDPVIQSGVREVWAWLCEKMDQEGYHEGR